MGKGLETKDDETCTQCLPYNIDFIDDLNVMSLIRIDIEGENID